MTLTRAQADRHAAAAIARRFQSPWCGFRKIESAVLNALQATREDERGRRPILKKAEAVGWWVDDVPAGALGLATLRRTRARARRQKEKRP